MAVADARDELLEEISRLKKKIAGKNSN